MNHPRQVPGDRFGLAFPTSIDSLLEQGPRFLTAAFRACATLDADNRVVAIDDALEFVAGGMGRKLLLRVRYARPRPDLHSELFVKFPRDFGDPLRELFSPPLQAEIDFALLSRQPGFPVAVPRCYFADYHADSCSGLLITERIGFGQDSIEAAHDKCQDYQLSDPLGHYQALTLALARIAGAHHKAGRLGAGLDEHYPRPDPESAKDRPPTRRPSWPSWPTSWRNCAISSNGRRNCSRPGCAAGPSSSTSPGRRRCSWSTSRGSAAFSPRRKTTSRSATGTPTSTTPGSGVTPRGNCRLACWTGAASAR